MLEDHALWKAYGCPIDLQELPAKVREAHLAILAGESERRREENEKAERERKKTSRKAGRR